MERTFRLKDFDGPLDLLLTLIGKAKIDIHDIFVSEITDQYIESVRSASDLDMDEASDFLVMAATLLEIKSRAMLPRPPEPDEEEGLDPEEELIRRLEEYQRFRESAQDLKRFEEAAKALFTKLPEEFPLPPPEIELDGLTLDGLTEAFLRVLNRKPPEEEDGESNHYHLRPIRRDEHNIKECMLSLLKTIRKRKRLRFEDAFGEDPSREEVITFFLAMLELMKLGEMHAVQTETEGDILLVSGKAEPAEMTEEEAVRYGRKKARK